MGPLNLYVTVKVAWWVHWYLRGVALVSFITGQEPDREKVMGWVLRGISVKHTRSP